MEDPFSQIRSHILFTYECKFSGSRAPGLTYGYCLVSMVTKYVVGCLVTMML